MSVRMKEYTLPPGCSIRRVVMRELTGDDELEAAVWADKATTPALAESVVGTITLAEREAIRLSLVEVDGKKVNVDGVPCAAMDGWNYKTRRCLQAYFQDLNGVAADAVKASVSSGRIVGGLEAVTEPESPAD